MCSLTNDHALANEILLYSTSLLQNSAIFQGLYDDFGLLWLVGRLKRIVFLDTKAYCGTFYFPVRRFSH